MEHLDITPRLADFRAATGDRISSLLRFVFKPLFWMAQGFAFLAMLVRNAFSRMVPYVSSPMFATSILLFIVFNRMLAFANPREPIVLSWKKLLILRGTAIAILGYPASYLWEIFQGQPVDTKWFYEKMNYAVIMSSAIELFSGLLEGKMPISDWGYSQPELSGIFQEIISESAPGLSPFSGQMACFTALVLVSQALSHVIGLFRLQRYQLIPSTIMGVCFIAYFLNSQLNTGPLKSGFIYIAVSYVRFGTQIIMLAVSAICWSIYWVAVAFVGDRSKMVAKRSFIVRLSSTFYELVLTIGYGALAASVDKTYLHEAASMNWPLATWLDKIYANDKNKIRATAPDGSVMVLHGNPSNPYAHEVRDAPRTDRENIKLEQARFAQIGYPTVKWIKSAHQFAKALATVIYLRVRDLIRSVPSRPVDAAPPPTLVLCDRIYKSLDSDPSSAYYGLLSGATLPEVDDSADFVPSDEFTDASDSGIDDSGDDYDDDISMCAENILGSTHSDHGVELVFAHMNSERVITRQSYLESLDPDRELVKVISELRRGADMTKCTICLENPRQVVLWPCRCLALCDECRLTLSARRFKNCVCCQQRVHSYSKVYLP